DANGCQTTASATITQPAAAISATIVDYTLGCTETNGTINLTVSGGTGGYFFDWDNDGTGDFNDNQNLTAGPGSYNVTIRDENGCEIVRTGNIIFTPCPELTIIKTQTAGQNLVTTPGVLTYTIVVTNTGNTSQTGVVVRDTLPNGTVTVLSGQTESLSANNIL
ncbi:DUF7507 domain-containing protein, partial [Lacihabitans soyangensis]|nr:DUF11 domain-containing protein [Lacihabitans soyangensis]